MAKPLSRVEPGAMVQLRTRPEATYQVVNVDAFSDHIWVRRWPLRSERSPTFSVTVSEIKPLLQPQGLE